MDRASYFWANFSSKFLMEPPHICFLLNSQDQTIATFWRNHLVKCFRSSPCSMLWIILNQDLIKFRSQLDSIQIKNFLRNLFETKSTRSIYICITIFMIYGIWLIDWRPYWPRCEKCYFTKIFKISLSTPLFWSAF